MSLRTFVPHEEIALRAWAPGDLDHGRLTAKAPIEVDDLDDPTQKRTGTTQPQFSLLTAGDVAGLAPGAVTRRFPAPGSSDAEQPKAALIELSPSDLPWRYTPARPGPQTGPPLAGASGQGLRPWLVLVVGEPRELSLAPDGTVAVGVGAQQAHPLAQSWMWAHVQLVGAEAIARILSPRPLRPLTLYLACLLPGFVVDSGETMVPAWDGGATARLPCYDHWSFTTGPEGDFPALAAKLRARSYADLGPAFGIGEVRYNRRGLGAPDRAAMGMEGALARVPAGGAGREDPTVQSAHSPVDPWVAAEVAALTADVPLPPGRWILTAPRYPEPYLGRGAPPTPGWGDELVEDPRRRAAAGLGAWNAIEWQDRIAAAAIQKAGDLLTAQDRIAHLGLGLEAARTLWRRRVPADPVGRLAVLSPVLGRLPERSAGTALDAVAGRARLTRALFSSAARRALRPGSARTIRAAEGAVDPRAVLAAACRCPPVPSDPGGGDPELTIKEAIYAAAHGHDPLAAQAVAQLPAAPSPDLLSAVLAALDPGGGRPPNAAALQDLLDGRSTPPALPLVPDGRDQPSCHEVDPSALGAAIAAAVDPTVERPLVVDRVIGTVEGLTDLRPVTLEPELDLPLWSFLRDNAPDWLLPGVGQMPLHSVVPLATNPGFVQALLVGANVQSTGELRWRRHPLKAKASPLRKFWQRADGALDINPIKTWDPGQGFGGAGLAFPGAGEEAVVVFRTPLFRRYPATVVYLYPADAVWDDSGLATLDPDQCVHPTFTGGLGDDVVLFGFPLPASAFTDHWVVLEEPPAGYRFYNVAPPAPPAGAVAPDDPSVLFSERDAAPDAGVYAKDSFAVPIRVMIGRLLELTP